MADPVLKEEDYQRIMAGIAAADEGIRQAELAQRAGVDVGTKLTTLKAQKDQLLKFKNVYFAGR